MMRRGEGGQPPCPENDGDAKWQPAVERQTSATLITYPRSFLFLQDMMKLGGIFCQKEATNFLLGKPDDPYITSYINHVSSHPSARKAPQHAIVPDLHAYNFPAGKKTINDSGATPCAEIIFEIKTYTACLTRYQQNNSKTTPVRPKNKRGGTGIQRKIQETS